MSVRKLTFGLLVAAALLAGQRGAEAQEHLPIADPFHFDPDFRWFEPVYAADLMDMKPSKRASTGWYGSYDKMRLYFSRPDVDMLREGNTSDFEDGLDEGWGDRIEVGFMLESGSGWSASYMNIGGPQAYETIFQERINRLNTEANIGPDEDDDSGNFGRFGLLLPSADRNNFELNERIYELQDSINVFNGSSMEINKTWRLEPYHYGGMLEPLIGLRYIDLNDYWQQEDYQRFQGLGNLVQLEDPDGNPYEVYTRNRARTDNKMFGGQLGARYFKYMDRFMVSGEFKAFAMANYQSHRSSNDQILTAYDGVGIDAETVYVVNTRNALAYRDNDEFVVGFDVRADVSYQLTRHFQIRGGFQMIDLGRGIWRGQIDDPTDQTVVMVGGTFGIALNR